MDADTGELSALVPADEWQARARWSEARKHSDFGTGRELFSHMRRAVSDAESGASVFRPVTKHGARILPKGYIVGLRNGGASNAQK